MVNIDRIVGNWFAPVSVNNENSFHYHQHHVKPTITVEGRNIFHQKTELHINASKAQLLSISGSGNRGLLLNDVHVNMTNIFDRPIFMHFNSRSIFHYFVPVIGALVIVIVLSLCFHGRQRQKQRLQTPERHFNEHQSHVTINQTKTRKMNLLSCVDVLESKFAF